MVKLYKCRPFNSQQWLERNEMAHLLDTSIFSSEKKQYFLIQIVINYWVKNVVMSSGCSLMKYMIWVYDDLSHLWDKLCETNMDMYTVHLVYIFCHIMYGNVWPAGHQLNKPGIELKFIIHFLCLFIDEGRIFYCTIAE